MKERSKIGSWDTNCQTTDGGKSGGKKANLLTQFSQEMMRALVQEESMEIERREWI